MCKFISPRSAFESSSICLEPAYLHRCSQGMTLVSGVSWGIALEWWECFLSFSEGCTQNDYWCFPFFHMVAQIPPTECHCYYTEGKTVERNPWFMRFSSIVVDNVVFISIFTCCSLLSGVPAGTPALSSHHSLPAPSVDTFPKKTREKIFWNISAEWNQRPWEQSTSAHSLCEISHN